MVGTSAAVWLVVLLLAADEPPSAAHHRLIDAPAASGPTLRSWPSLPPDPCPFESSRAFAALGFTGRHAEYAGADTWYPSWASDGNLYSPWTDGSVNGLAASSPGEHATTGHATIVGDDPMHLEVRDQGVFASSPLPYEGRYPCGSLVHDGVWYYGTYCLHPAAVVNRPDGAAYNWPWLGPFVGFRTSTDLGKTWTQTPCTPEHPLFGEHALHGEPVRIGAPHFVDLGRNLQHSPDGKAYLVAHGASEGGPDRRFGFNSWITGDEIYLARVTPSPQTINDASRYEFFAGKSDAGADRWSRDLSAARPIAAWKDHMGCVTMTYDAPLKTLLLCVTDGTNTCGYFNTYLLASDRMTGPWKLVQYLKHFGEQAYFVNIPSKFVGGDGRTFWLCYAANFAPDWNGLSLRARPRGSRYAMCLQEVRLLTPAEHAAAGPLGDTRNVAPDASVLVSSTHRDSRPEGAVDGVVSGYPGLSGHEWASAGERTTAMLRLMWDGDETVDRVWLFDRPNDSDQVTSGLLMFSDGKTIATGALPDDARRGLEVRFPPKTIRWLIFAVTGVKKSTQNIGLSEIAVFRPD